MTEAASGAEALEYLHENLSEILLLDPLLKNWSLIAVPQTIAFGGLVAILFGAGVIISAVGSGLSLRRFLRV